MLLPTGNNSTQLYDVICKEGIIDQVHVQSSNLVHSPHVKHIDGNGGLLLPSLCHSHVHLDKCNILNECRQLVSGTFQEALQVTSEAKASYTYESLIARGKDLILESVKYGVTAMRAHVEVDRIVQFACLDVGLQLKEELKEICDIELAVFAQDPLFTSASEIAPSDNYALLREAGKRKGISAIGSAPYVEPSLDQALRNINYVFELAMENRLHIDFHLDYNLDPSVSPMIYHVIDVARRLNWVERMQDKRIAIGHAPRLCLFTPEEFAKLREAIGDLPITFIGLPQTDIYMLGRETRPGPRGTLHVPDMTAKHGLDVGMSINNIGNAFTPQGSADPVSLCTFGVAIFQTGLVESCNILYVKYIYPGQDRNFFFIRFQESVSNTSKKAVGVKHSQSLVIKEGDPADLVIVHGRKSIQSVVLNPGIERTVIKSGRVISSRRVALVVDPSSVC